MTNLEFYKDEIIKMFEEDNSTPCLYIKELDKFENCHNCHLHKESEIKYCDKGKVVDWLLAEHKKTIKLKQWEYDVICNMNNSDYACTSFSGYKTFLYMKQEGLFKGVEDIKMSLQEILYNCEIVPNDYKWEK